MSGALARRDRWVGAAGLIRSWSEYVALSGSGWRGRRAGLAESKRLRTARSLVFCPPPPPLPLQSSREGQAWTLSLAFCARADRSRPKLLWNEPRQAFFAFRLGERRLKRCGEYLVGNRRRKLTKELREKDASGTVLKIKSLPPEKSQGSEWSGCNPKTLLPLRGFLGVGCSWWKQNWCPGFGGYFPLS